MRAHNKFIDDSFIIGLIENGVKTKTLARALGVSHRTIQKKIKKIDDKLLLKHSDKKIDEYGRFIKEGKDYEPLTRNNNGAWKGGVSTYRDMAFKEYGFEQKCKICDEDDPTKIVIHHIDKNRKNNKKDNLVPCCNSCHMKVFHPDSILKAQRARMKNLENKKSQQEIMFE